METGKNPPEVPQPEKTRWVETNEGIMANLDKLGKVELTALKSGFLNEIGQREGWIKKIDKELESK